MNSVIAPICQDVTNVIGARRGKVTFHRIPGKTRTEFFLYVPLSAQPDAPVLVAVHGITRNAADHAFRFRTLAEQHGVVVIAPLFEDKHYPRYQQVFDKDGARSDRALFKMVKAVGSHVPCNIEKLNIFGFSGGGQFAHRLAMAHPDRVASVVIGAAGWYTFPDAERPFPFGLKEAPSLKGKTLSPEQFLSIKYDVVVGTEDTMRDASLRQSQRLDAQQGFNRIERGRRWVEAMNVAAESFGHMPRNSFRLLAGVNHSFATFFESSRLGAIVFESLGLERPARPDLSRRWLDARGVVKTCETISLPDAS